MPIPPTCLNLHSAYSPLRQFIGTAQGLFSTALTDRRPRRYSLIQQPLIQQPLIQQPLIQQPLIQQPLLQQPPSQKQPLKHTLWINRKIRPFSFMRPTALRIKAPYTRQYKKVQQSSKANRLQPYPSVVINGMNTRLSLGKTQLATMEQLKKWVLEASVSKSPPSLSKHVPPIKIANLLHHHNAALELHNMIFENTEWLKNTDLSGIHFQHCSFKSVQLSNTLIEDASFNHCDFFQTNFSSANIRHCYFVHSHFEQTDFLQSTLEHCHFNEQSHLNLCSFESALIHTTVFDAVTIKDTHFFNAQADQNRLQNSVLEDVSFMQPQPTQWQWINTQARHIKPKVSILTNPDQPGLTTPKALIKLVQEAKVSPLRIAYVQPKPTHWPIPEQSAQALDRADDRQINVEVNDVLSVIQQASHKRPSTAIDLPASKSISIPQQLIQQVNQNPKRYPALKAIFANTVQLVSQLDAIYLPGGEDLPPALYGQVQHPETQWNQQYRRALLEISLIHQSQQQGIPLMAICRGFQITAVYHGATLIQHLDGQKGLQKFVLNPQNPSSLYQSIFKEGSSERPLISAVLHHQTIAANDFPQEALDSSVLYPALQDLPSTLLVKAAEPKQGASAPAILLQFHPEFYAKGTRYELPNNLEQTLDPSRMSNSNDQFWTLFSDAARTFENKRRLNRELKMRLGKV